MKHADAPRLSDRLTLLAGSVCTLARAYGEKPCLADIGCDHALVPVSLLQSGVLAFAYASDIREGPLETAKENALRFGVADRMRFVLADGLAGIGRNEAEICLISGMGGELIREILETGNAPEKGIAALVLSPHTKQETLREYLADSPYRIAEERITKEDGKIYPVIVACTDDAPNAIRPETAMTPDVAEALCRETRCTTEDAKRLCNRYGPLLLQRRHPVLKEMLEKEAARLSAVLQQALAGKARPEEAAEEMRLVQAALQWFARGKTGETL